MPRRKRRTSERVRVSKSSLVLLSLTGVVLFMFLKIPPENIAAIGAFIIILSLIAFIAAKKFISHRFGLFTSVVFFFLLTLLAFDALDYISMTAFAAFAVAFYMLVNYKQ